MKRALLAFLASRVVLVLALVLLSPVENWCWPEDTVRPYRGSTEHGLVDWKVGGANDRYLFHPAPLVDAWFRHDSDFYLQVAVFGYGPAEEGHKTKEGFFPGYPLLMTAVRPVAEPLARLLQCEETGNVAPWPLVAGLLVSNLAALGTVILIVLLASRLMDPVAGSRAGVILAVNPLGFLLGAGLTEATFLLVVTGAFMAMERRKLLLAGVLGACATLVRITGLAMLLPLAMVSFQRRKGLAAADFLSLPLVPAGLLLALLVIGSGAGDPWTYFRVQAGFGHEGFPTLQGVVDLFSLRTLLPFEAHRNLLQVTVLLACMVLLVFQCRLSARGQLPWHLLLYSLPMLGLPLLAGNVISLPRYALVIMPFYLVAARVLPHGRPAWILAGLSLLLQALLFLGFKAHLPIVI